jgi:hypothetical protein
MFASSDMRLAQYILCSGTCRYRKENAYFASRRPATLKGCNNCILDMRDLVLEYCIMTFSIVLSLAEYIL